MTFKKLEFQIILGLSTMSKDKVIIVFPTLDTLRNIKKQEEYKGALKKDKAKRKDTGNKGGMQEDPQKENT